MNPKILAHKQRLDSLYSKVAIIPVPQDQAEWSKYLCVLTAGFIEESLYPSGQGHLEKSLNLPYLTA